jgi:hypothetical protein
MIARLTRPLARLVIRWPGWVAAAAAIVTIVLYSHIHALRTATDLTGMFGNNDPQWQTVSRIGNELGYGNQLYVLVLAPEGGQDPSEQMEQVADRLTQEMSASGLFKSARSGLSEEELLGMVRLFSWNFPAYADAGNSADLRGRLDPRQIHANVRAAATELVTPFSTLGAGYFVADPLGLTAATARDAHGLNEFGSFDLSWGSGNRFFSKDHKALMILAEPRQSAVDYQFSHQVMEWTRQHIAGATSAPEVRDAGLRAVPAGAYVYSEEDHLFIEKNIRRVSLVSIVGSLLLCLAVYPNVQIVFLSLLPTGLGILWTTGIASYYPGEVNLISLSFIAILAGLGDDQVVHFFNRSPQEWEKGGSFNDAMQRTFETTGTSIVLCILTAATSTAALACSGFKALSEFGFILTVGMFMTGLHTLLTVPALMQLWGRYIKPLAPKAITFRFLPAAARVSVDFVGRHARAVAISAAGLFLLSLCLLPSLRWGGNFAVENGADSPGLAAQNLLSSKYGIAGSPDVLLIAGSEQEVLRRAENLASGLDEYQKQGVVKSVFSPTQLLPSAQTQALRAQSLQGVDLDATALALRQSLAENGFRLEPYAPYFARLHALSQGAPPLTLETAEAYLPADLMENSIRRTQDGSYVAAIAFYAADPNATQVIPDSVLKQWRDRYGPFVDFSFNKIDRDLQSRVSHDSRRALLWTAGAIFLIVYIAFRRLSTALLVLMPIGFAIVVTFGLLQLAGHRFSMMAITALPLIVGIGIDNGIHLVRRYLESDRNRILAVAKASGAALIQSNLTTIVGFGALMTATFKPLAEMGLVTSVGVALTLAGGFWLIPAILHLREQSRAKSETAAADL